MSLLDKLTVALFVAWCLSEVTIRLINLLNRPNRGAWAEDRFSFFAIWLALMVTIALAMIVWLSRRSMAGLGDEGAVWSLLGWLGCACLAAGITIRLVAVATLRRYFTTTVTILAQHRLVDSSLYRYVRHPAYLGLLLSLLGFGLCSGNWISLAVAIGLPLTAVLYRIRVEEQALLRHFGAAYAAYADCTKRLLPGVY